MAGLISGERWEASQFKYAGAREQGFFGISGWLDHARILPKSEMNDELSHFPWQVGGTLPSSAVTSIQRRRRFDINGGAGRSLLPTENFS
jgi:hypothetical protein